MHDILEDTAIKENELNNIFGTSVVDYIKQLTKITFEERCKMLTNEQAFIKLINQDPLVVCIKLADRIHNLYTVDGHSKESKKRAIAQETLDFFISPAQKYRLDDVAEILINICKYILKNGTLNGYKHVKRML